MVKMREALLNGEAKLIADHMKKSFSIAPGLIYCPDTDCLCSTLRQQMQWDALAYLVVRLAIANGGGVFGGFLAAHLSGNCTNDVDLVFANFHDIVQFKKSLVVMLSFILGYATEHFDFVLMSKSGVYCHKHTLFLSNIGSRGEECVEVKVDIAMKQKLSRKSGFPPVTWGRRLMYTLQHGFRYRELACLQQEEEYTFPIDTLMQLLKQGKDRLLILNSFDVGGDLSRRVKYRQYLKEKESRLCKQGYILDVDLHEKMRRMNIL